MKGRPASSRQSYLVRRLNSCPTAASTWAFGVSAPDGRVLLNPKARIADIFQLPRLVRNRSFSPRVNSPLKALVVFVEPEGVAGPVSGSELCQASARAMSVARSGNSFRRSSAILGAGQLPRQLLGS